MCVSKENKWKNGKVKWKQKKSQNKQMKNGEKKKEEEEANCSCFRSLVPWGEGACRTVVSVPCCRHVVQIRVVWSFEMWFWSLGLGIPSKDILVGTAPLDCVEIPCVEGKISFCSRVVFDCPIPGLCSGRWLELPVLPSPSRGGFPAWKACGRSQRLTLGALLSFLS